MGIRSGLGEWTKTPKCVCVSCAAMSVKEQDTTDSSASFAKWHLNRQRLQVPQTLKDSELSRLVSFQFPKHTDSWGLKPSSSLYFEGRSATWTDCLFPETWLPGSVGRRRESQLLTFLLHALVLTWEINNRWDGLAGVIGDGHAHLLLLWAWTVVNQERETSVSTTRWMQF